MKLFKFLFLGIFLTLIFTNSIEAQKKKSTKKAKAPVESEYVPTDPIDDYVPVDNLDIPEASPSSNSSNKPKSAKVKPGNDPIVATANDTVRAPDADAPLDDIVKRDMIQKKLVLPYEPIHERDILWERRVWRVIDCREKMNLAFRYPDEELFTILKKGIEKGSIKAYSKDDFHFKFTTEDVNSQISKRDTQPVVDVETGETTYKLVKNDIDVQTINQYRVKETWFFDSESSTLKVRILGIAPMIVEIDNASGVELPPRPLFWIYYPDCRKYLSEFKVFNEENIASPISWEDLFEMRHFSSYITMRSNVNKYRLQDYEEFKENGIDRLLESNKIKEEIFNFEHDLWSY